MEVPRNLIPLTSSKGEFVYFCALIAVCNEILFSQTPFKTGK